MNQMNTQAFGAPAEEMAARSMKLYYRHRKNGATVFRLEVANRQRRIELNQIATISKIGEIQPHKRRAPTDAETVEIADWWMAWQARSSAEELSDSEKFLVQLNEYTDWMSRRASDDEVDSNSDPLLMAILDLRQALVRRLSGIPGEQPLEDHEATD